MRLSHLPALVASAFDQRVTKTVKTFLATWQPAGGILRVVLVKEGDGSWRAYFCTKPEATAAQVLEAVADRGAIEQTFKDVEEHHDDFHRAVAAQHVDADVLAVPLQLEIDAGVADTEVANPHLLERLRQPRIREAHAPLGPLDAQPQAGRPSAGRRSLAVAAERPPPSSPLRRELHQGFSSAASWHRQVAFPKRQRLCQRRKARFRNPLAFIPVGSVGGPGDAARETQRVDGPAPTTDKNQRRRANLAAGRPADPSAAESFGEAVRLQQHREGEPSAKAAAR